MSGETEPRSVNVHFGAMSPRLTDQLSEQRLTADAEKIEHFQKDADAVTRLKVRGLLTTGQADAARRKICKRVASVAVAITDTQDGGGG